MRIVREQGNRREVLDQREDGEAPSDQHLRQARGLEPARARDVRGPSRSAPGLSHVRDGTLEILLGDEYFAIRDFGEE